MAPFVLVLTPSFGLALALLNASLTLVNVWPTPFVRLSGDLSLEVLGVAALLVLLHRVVASRRVGMARVLAGIWVKAARSV